MTRKKITGSIPVKTPKKATAKRTYKRRNRPTHVPLPIVTNTMNSLSRRASADPSGYGYTPPEPNLVQPIPATMSRITLAQDDMDGMIERLTTRLEAVLGGPIPQQDKGTEAVDHRSTHHRDLLNHLYRVQQQEERLGQLIDRLTL